MNNFLRARVLVYGLAGALLLSGSGCGEYTAAPQRYSEFWSRLRVDLPKGWLQHTKAKGGYTITKDGIRLERITIGSVRVGEKLKGTDRVFSAGMMPNEAADLSVGLIKARGDLKNFDVQKIDAVPLGGKDGYRVDATYVDDGGLRKRVRLHGVILGQYVCELVYEAAEPVYFEKYEGAFNGVVASARTGQ